MTTVGGQQPTAPADAPFVAGEVLVKFRQQAPTARRNALLASIDARLVRHFDAIDMHHVRLPRGVTVESAIAALRADGDVLVAQPNYLRAVVAPAPPNDPFWLDNTLYGLQKIQAEPVWNTLHQTGSNAIVVADVDTGVNYLHPDLVANIWINPGESGSTTQEGPVPNCTSRGLALDKSCNNLDDDGNGYVDDVHGINSLTHTGDPFDDHGHGTHTSGTMGAVGNNGIGVTGVNWNVKILGCKFLNSFGSGDDAGATECFDYLVKMKTQYGINIRVSNNSWGGGGASQTLKDAIDAAGTAGILNVFAAGNSGTNNDAQPFYPAAFTSPSIVAVAASDSSDNRAAFSNFGQVSVDLAAPGVGIVSTVLGTQYATASGTSMASPHVAGSAALLLSINPDVPVDGLKSLLLSNVDVLPQWSGLVASGGRLNVFRAAQALLANAPPSVSVTNPSNSASLPAAPTIPI